MQFLTRSSSSGTSEKEKFAGRERWCGNIISSTFTMQKWLLLVQIQSLFHPRYFSLQVLVRVIYAGVNPVETYIREGQYSRLPDPPYVPGSDASGYVEALGARAGLNKRLRVGQRVFVTHRQGSK